MSSFTKPFWRGSLKAAKLGPDHTANLRLTNVNGHPVFVVHREATAPAEYHETYAHLIYVISGEATVVVGGELAFRPGHLIGSRWTVENR